MMFKTYMCAVFDCTARRTHDSQKLMHNNHIIYNITQRCWYFVRVHTRTPESKQVYIICTNAHNILQSHRSCVSWTEVDALQGRQKLSTRTRAHTQHEDVALESNSEIKVRFWVKRSRSYAIVMLFTFSQMQVCFLFKKNKTFDW